MLLFSPEYNSIVKKIIVAGILILSFTVCFLLGSRILQHGDFFYLSDQARDFSLVRDIVIDHKLTLIGTHSGVGGLFHGPLWLYMLIPFFILGKGNPFIFTYWYVTIPLITILIGFVVGCRLYNKVFGILVAFLLAINPILWGYINSTQAINLIPLLYIIFIYFVILYIRGKQNAFIFVVFLVGLAFQFETASAIALIPAVLIIALLNKRHIPQLRILFYSMLAFMLSLTTFILFDLRHKFLILRATIQIFNQNQGHKDYINFLQRINDHMITMKNTYFSIFPMQSPYVIFLGIIIFLLFLFLLTTNSTKQKTFSIEFLFLFLMPAFVFLFYVFYPHPIYEEYILDLVVSIIFAWSLMLITVWKNALGKVFVSVFIFVTVFSVGMQLRQTYFHPYIPDTSAGSYLNQKHVTEWIWNDAKGKTFGYFVYTPETFTYGMDYLFWWESNMRKLPAPESKKLAVTYLILYPPLAHDENAHIFWIKNTIHSIGPVEKTEIFQGGIIVEKVDMSHDTEEVDQNYYQKLIFR